MLSVYRTLSIRYLARRWFRAVLIVASIALGVATLVATRSLSETMNKAGLQASNPLAGTADLLITNGDNLVQSALVRELVQVEGVQSAHPRIFAKVKLPDVQNRLALLLGIDLSGEMKNTSAELPFRITDENLFALPFFPLGQSVAIGQELAQTLPDRNQPLRLQPPGSQTSVTVSRAGTIEATGPAAVLAGFAILMDVQAAGRLLGHAPGEVQRIDLVLEKDANRERVQQDIREVLRGRAEVHTPDEQNQMVQNIFAGMQAGFSMCGAAALVVGLFLVYNALAVSVAERRHEIGILLSLGATRGQIRRLFAGEAAILGLAGSLLGIPLGLGLAYLGLQPVQGVLRDIFMALEASQVEVSPTVIGLAIVTGIVTAVAAALVPAIQAANENPAEAVRRIPPQPTWRYRALQVFASVGLIGLGLLLTLLRGVLPARFGIYMGMTVVLLGLLMATPLLASLAARILQPLFRTLLGIEGRLAADNLVRSPARTGLVIAALAAGVALVMQTAGVIRSNRLALRDWVEESIGAHLFVTSGSPVAASADIDAMPPELGAALEKIPGVQRALPLRTSKQYYDQTKILVMAVAAGDIYTLDPQRREKHDLFRQLNEQADGVIISDNFRALHGVHAGDTITLASPRGPVTLHVLGTMVDYSWNHGSLIVRRQDYLKHWGDAKVDVFDLYLENGADPLRVRDDINHKLAAQHGLIVQTRDELQNYIDGMIERLYGIAYAQLVVVMCVAALGVITSLMISVLQRRREMGLLRAIGASQVQVVRSVLAEATLMGIIGTLIGLLIGIPIEYYVLKVVILEETGYLFPVYIPWSEALIIAVAALGLATAAGLGPALYAIRQRIPEAIAYE